MASPRVVSAATVALRWRHALLPPTPPCPWRRLANTVATPSPLATPFRPAVPSRAGPTVRFSTAPPCTGSATTAAPSLPPHVHGADFSSPPPRHPHDLPISSSSTQHGSTAAGLTSRLYVRYADVEAALAARGYSLIRLLLGVAAGTGVILASSWGRLKEWGAAEGADVATLTLADEELQAVAAEVGRGVAGGVLADEGVRQAVREVLGQAVVELMQGTCETVWKRSAYDLVSESFAPVALPSSFLWAGRAGGPLARVQSHDSFALLHAGDALC